MHKQQLVTNHGQSCRYNPIFLHTHTDLQAVTVVLRLFRQLDILCSVVFVFISKFVKCCCVGQSTLQCASTVSDRFQAQFLSNNS